MNNIHIKKIIFILAAIILVNCKEEPKNYVTLSGKITNKYSDSLLIRAKNYSKTIKVNPDGTFKDTLNIKPNIYNVFDGKQSTFIFLRNGFDLNMTLNAKDFYKSISFSGIGSEHSNFIAKNNLINQKLINLETLSALEIDELDAKFERIKKELIGFYDANKNVDTLITNRLRKDLDPMLDYYKRGLAEFISSKAIIKGALSPVFKDYENAKGGKTSLTDFKGKYVYIDVWATWCGPCMAEIPALKNLEKANKGKNIEFVSLSVDDGRGYNGDTTEESITLAKQAWKKIIHEKQLGGTQIIAPNGWESQFIKDYSINGIPRFILIDPEGKIVAPDAPRPSSKDIIALFKELGI